YYRRVRRGFVAALSQRAVTAPYPVEHCALCEFREVCDERWAREDNLSLVAGIRREQVKRLRAGGIDTLAGLAGSPETTKVDHVAPHTFETLHDQAALQLTRRVTGRLEWRVLPVEEKRGFHRLPRPSPGEVIFDLHGVVRQGLRAGVSSYSLKEIEALPAFRRRAGVVTGTRAVLEYERWMHTRDDGALRAIAVYNEDDCRATLALREWLLARRPNDAVWAEVPDAREVAEEKRAAENEREALRQSLLAGSEEGSPRWLAGELLEYHRREARPAWWWFFARCKMSSDELFEDSESIGRLRLDGRPVAAKRSTDYRFSFPPQQHKLSPGDVPIDPATGKPAGTIQLVDDASGVIVLRRGPSLASVPLPSALIPPKPYDTVEQRAALARL